MISEQNLQAPNNSNDKKVPNSANPDSLECSIFCAEAKNGCAEDQKNTGQKIKEVEGVASLTSLSVTNQICINSQAVTSLDSTLASTVLDSTIKAGTSQAEKVEIPENSQNVSSVGSHSVQGIKDAVGIFSAEIIAVESSEHEKKISQSVETDAIQRDKQESKELTQEMAFAAMFNTGQIIAFSHNTYGQKVMVDDEKIWIPFYYTYPFPQYITLQHFCLNPYKPSIPKKDNETKEETRARLESERRVQDNLLYRHGITLELDVTSLDFQRQWASSILPVPTVQVFSGNKSIHNHFIFDRPLTENEDNELVTLFQKAFPFADFGVISGATHFCRVPGAYRKDNGKKQAILAIGKKFDPSFLIGLLQSKTAGISEIPRLAQSSVSSLYKGYAKVNGQEVALTQEKRLELWQATLRNLWLCGYSIPNETWLLKAILDLAHTMPNGFNLDQEIESARNFAANSQAAKKARKEVTRSAQNEGKLTQWVQNELMNVDLLSVMRGYGLVQYEHQTGNKSMIPCPWHKEDVPSCCVYQDDKDGIEKAHCFHHGFSRNALEIVQEFGGLDFLSACQAVFHKLPPYWCNECGKEITFDNNSIAHNPDGTQHFCKAPHCNQCQQEIMYKLSKNGKKYPCDLDGTPHKCVKFDPTDNQTNQESNAQKEPEKESSEARYIQVVNTVLDDFDKAIFSEILQKLENIHEGMLCFLHAPTGIGKTYALVYLSLLYIASGFKVIFHSATKDNMYQVFEYAKEILTLEPEKFSGVSIDDLEPVESGREYEGLSSEIQEQTNTKAKKRKNKKEQRTAYKKMIVTSYGYLGRKGHLAHGYLCYPEMIEDRIVIFDEMQKFIHATNVQFPLVGKYQDNGKTCKHVKYCPKSARRGDCRNCVYALLRQEPQNRENTRDFHPSFAGETLTAYQKNEDSPIEFGLKLNEQGIFEIVPVEYGESLHSFMYDTQLYETVYKTLLYRCLEPRLQEMTTAFTGDGTIKDYIHELQKTLVNPHVRIEYPINKETGEPINPVHIAQQMKDDTFDSKLVQFPKQACGCPTLCGFDTLPFWQLRGIKVTKTVHGEPKEIAYKGAKAVIFASATMPQTIVDYAQQTLEFKGRFEPAKKMTCSDTPCKFDVEIFSTESEFSNDTVKAIYLDCLDHGLSPLVVSAKKNEYIALRIGIKGKYCKQTVYFEDGEFYEDLKTSHKTKSLDPVIKGLLTYARSAIMTGENFPEYNLLIVDCSFFGPMLALQGLLPGMNELERLQVIYGDIVDILTQVVGRILRTFLSRIPGQTVFDHSKKRVILHGIPKGLQFDIEERLCNQETYHHHKETWYDPENVAKTVVDSLLKSLDGIEIPNYQVIAAQKAANKKTNQMSHSQREQANTEIFQQTRSQSKAIEYMEQLAADFKKIEAAKKMGLTYKEIAIKFTLSKNPELRNKTKQLFGMSLEDD